MKQKTNHTAPTDGCLQFSIEKDNHTFEVPTAQFRTLLEKANVPKNTLAKYATPRSMLTVAEVVGILKDEVFADVRNDIYLAIIEGLCAYGWRADTKTSSQYLSIKEFAKRTNLCRASIEKYIHTGKLEAIRLGRSYRIHKDILNRWHEGCDIPNNE